LVAIFSKHVKQSSKSNQISIDDFEKIKIIGKGGFAEKVYLARKKDNGQLFAIKTMCKKFILEEQGRFD
jgi:serine/threonine protein kinase